MTVYSGLFNSVNGDRKYNAWWFALYFSTFIGNGIFPNPARNLQVTENTGLTTKVRPGKAWANGHFLFSDDDHILTHDAPDAILNRIDRVVLRLDYLSRLMEITIKKGALASSPVPPVLQRDADIYELAIADVFIGVASTTIPQSKITDLRLNPELCGIVHGLVDQVDTSAIFDQYQSWFTSYSVTKAAEFLDWENATKQSLLDWVDSEHLDFENWRASEEALYYSWLAGKRKEFDDWFELVKGTLGTDSAGNLLNLINDHKDESMPHKFLIGPQVYKYGLAHNPLLDCVAFIYEEEL